MDLIRNDKIKLKAMNILEQLVAEKNESVLEKLVAEGREQGELIGREQGELEGRVEGLMEGEQKVLIETVQHLQGILKCVVDTTEELTVKSLEELRVQRDLLECEIAKKLSS